MKVHATILMAGIAWLNIAAAGSAQESAVFDAIRKNEVYERFNRFCKQHFGAEQEPLVYQKFGKELVFVEEGAWSHVSENSAVIAWETNLPATSHLEYGETQSYGKQTLEEERPFALHVHYLTGLETGQTYHYRLVSVDERGNVLASEDRQITPQRIEGAIHVPGEMKGPPYRLDKSRTYVLTADIDAEVTGIDITASNLVLDLNGHTITYDTSQDAYEKVKDTDAFREGFGPKPNDGPHGVRGSYASQKGGVRIINGFVRQGDGGHSWWSAPITAPFGDEVAGVTMVYHGPQVYGITAEMKNMHHNVFVDLGTEIPNRHQGVGAILIGRHAHHNLIKRSRHRGIDVPRTNGKVYRNEIYIDSFATNGFGVFHYQSRKATCNDNRIFGTGYHFIGIGTISQGVGDIKVDGNFIHGRSLEETGGRWSEYGDQSGVNGLRVTWGGDNIEWSNNVVVVEGRGSAKGEVRGVWHVPDQYQKNLVYHDNIFKAVADREKDVALGAVVISGGNNPEKDFPGLFRDNTIISDFANVSLGGEYYGPGTNGRFEHNTFVKIGDREDYRTIQAGAQGGDNPSSGHVFVDSVFEKGTGYDKVRWREDGDFTVGWTVTIKTVPNAQVSIRDQSGEVVLSESSGEAGILKAVLMQDRYTRTEKTALTPHTVTVEKGTEKILERKITVNRTMDVTLMPGDGTP